MNPLRLALRTLLLGPPRARLAAVVIAASLCGLDLFAGHIASEHSRLEYQAVVGERLGHMAVTSANGRQRQGFDPAEAARIRRIAERIRGVALVVPQIDVAGVASSGSARVVDSCSTAGCNTSARSLQMPFGMAQTLLDTGRTARLAVYLTNPAELETRRAELLAALRGGGLAAEVQTWRELSAPYAQALRAADLKFACVGAIVLVLVGATLAATVAMNALERRREMAMLRALGMRGPAVFALVTAEAMWITMLGAALSVVASGLIAWVANRGALTWAAQPGHARPLMLVELDFGRMLAALAAVLALALLAALAPALRAARADVARDLAWGGGHPGW